jgi:hypothetical protein
MDGEAAQLWLFGVITAADKSCSLKRRSYVSFSFLVSVQVPDL